MIGWIIRKTYSDLIPVYEFQQPLHELGTTTLILWSIIHIDDERLDVGKALFHALPPLHQTIHQTVAGHFGGDPVQKELSESGQENAHRRHGGFCLKIMVSRLGQHTALSSSCKGTDFDRGFGIHRKA